MTPIENLRPGLYKLNSWVKNPEGRPREMDWRLKEAWDFGMKFRCFDVYYDGHCVPALYAGNQPGQYVHAHAMPTVFNALIEHLERI